MEEIDRILRFNKAFVENRGYESHKTDSGIPQRSVLIVSCMDTRLSVMLPDALGIRNGECKVVKVAGGVVLDDYDSVMRSIIIGIYELGIKEIMMIHHSDCGAGKMEGHHMKDLIAKRVTADELAKAEREIDLEEWLDGFGCTEHSVYNTVHHVRHHHLVPADVIVRGFIINSQTGELTEVDCD